MNKSSWNKGKKLSVEHKKKLSLAKLGMVPWNKDKTDVYSKSALKKISESHKGKKLTEEHKNKISVGNKCKIIKDETRLKVSKANTGRILSVETRLKYSNRMKKVFGKNSPNWKGGITPINIQIRHSERYKIWRKKVFGRDNWTCQDCGIREGRLEADHIKPFSLFPKLRFELNNGRTLCRECHTKTPTYGTKALRNLIIKV